MPGLREESEREKTRERVAQRHRKKKKKEKKKEKTFNRRVSLSLSLSLPPGREREERRGPAFRRASPRGTRGASGGRGRRGASDAEGRGVAFPLRALALRFLFLLLHLCDRSRLRAPSAAVPIFFAEPKPAAESRSRSHFSANSHRPTFHNSRRLSWPGSSTFLC